VIVVAIKQIAKIGMKPLVAWAKFSQYKLFKKPGSMSQVPLGWAHKVDGLGNVVFYLQRCAQVYAVLPNGFKLGKYVYL
jgi:hypothetical protein